MGKKLFVGNLAFSVTDEGLSTAFGQCGTVESAKIIIDRETGRSKGFGFVEMSNESEAQSAIEQLHNNDLMGRSIVVNEAKPMAPRDGGSRNRFSNNRNY